jgi:hypothetical protein
MKPWPKDITPAGILAAYDALVQGGGSAALEADLRAMRTAFQDRTGAFRPDDPSVEVDARTRAFWDDALTTRGAPSFAASAAAAIPDPPAPGTAAADALEALVPALARAHRGLFVVEETSLPAADAHLVDLWSGAELVVRVLDEAQGIALRHAHGALDGRVVAPGRVDGAGPAFALYLLPGAFHHPADATPHLAAVLDKARDSALSTAALLDALLRMERVLRTSSRVKAAYAYRTSGLVRAAAAASSTPERQGAR